MSTASSERRSARAIIDEVESGSKRRVSRRTPTRLGRYELLEKIASGGMASVFIGRAVGAGGFSRTVAIKKCHPHLSEDEKFRNMFLREARLAAQIHHPNVVPTIDVVVGEDLYMVMEYIEGGRLSDLTAATQEANQPFPVSIALAIILDALRGLHAAHTAVGSDGTQLRVIHRDVSPQNLMVGVDGVTRVVDFGVAKALEAPATTKSGDIKGKLAYMAPEQLDARRQLTPSTDVFAAGIVLWELLAGRSLFSGDSQADTMQRVLYIPIPKLPARDDIADESLRSAIKRALDRDPNKRYQSARAFAEAIETCGLPFASHDEVATFVRGQLSETLRERRQILRDSAVISEPEVETAARTERTPPSRWLPLTLGLLALIGGVSLYLFLDAGTQDLDAGTRDTATTEPSVELEKDPMVDDIPPLPMPAASSVAEEQTQRSEQPMATEDTPTAEEEKAAGSEATESQAQKRAPRRKPRVRRNRAPKEREPFRPDKI